MKTYTQKIIAAFLFTALFSLSAQAQTITGSYVPAYTQSQSNWCWAACTEMIYWACHSGSISQCTAVNKSRDLETSWWGIGGCNNISHSSTSACSSPSTFNSPQSMYGCNGSIASILDSYGMGTASYGYALSSSTVASNLSDKKLMIARWGWNSGGGHFVVINRYKSGYVYFNNPASGSANTWTYSTFCTANGSGTWTHTLRMNSASDYGTVYYRQAGEETKSLSTEELSLNMYPNPATEKINILINGEKNTDSKVIITDAVGKVVFTNQYAKDITAIPLDVANWSRGIYFVSINNDKKLSKTFSLR